MFRNKDKFNKFLTLINTEQKKSHLKYEYKKIIVNLMILSPKIDYHFLNAYRKLLEYYKVNI